MTAVVWFRSDLRTSDQTALTEAVARHQGKVRGVFFVTPDQWTAHDWGQPKRDFVLRNLVALESALARLGIPLEVRLAATFADCVAELPKLVRERAATAVYWNREYEWNERQRDSAAAKALRAAGVTVVECDDQTVLPPDHIDLVTGQERPYTVFTPFKKRWYSIVSELNLHRAPLLSIPSVAQPLSESKLNCAAQLASWGLDPSAEQTAEKSQRLAAVWPAGERAAEAKLTEFCQSRLTNYARDRDFPVIDGTSSLSPYLSAGVISPRRCLQAALAASSEPFEISRTGAATWISELIWREFYRYVMWHFPRVCRYRAFQKETDSIPWRHDRGEFERWATGQTGCPIIDAAMRQLLDIGWMHNRLRMIVAMYLAKDLLIDWRWGERHFMQHLVDADLGSNNGGWQWTASTGTDAAPYFRIFNPVTQSRKFDPEGRLIRRYCPELAQLDDDQIHEPYANKSLFTQSLNYPQPLVDHAVGRERTLAAFKVARTDPVS